MGGSAAEEQLRAARTHMRDGDYGRALPHLRNAAELLPESSELALWVAWADWVSSGRADGGRAKILSMARHAVGEDPELGLAYYVLGCLAKDQGDEKRASAFLARAVQLDAELHDAKRQLRLLTMPRSDAP